MLLPLSTPDGARSAVSSRAPATPWCGNPAEGLPAVGVRPGFHQLSASTGGAATASAVATAAALSSRRRQHRRARAGRKRHVASLLSRPAASNDRMGYSQRVDDKEFDDDEEAGTTVLDFGPDNAERFEKIKDFVRTPVTLLSGFLGAGKTSLLKHLLENQEGVRLGVVVNDVAAVNIDAQLIQRYERGGAIEMAELSNGCVCCTASDDLVASVQDLVGRRASRPFHHVIIELSGVGEPERISHHWDIGVEVGMPACLMTEIKRKIAVVDASLFGTDWLDSRKATERNEEGARHEGFETVGQLLADQVEKADLVILNKMDIATEDELLTTEQVIKGLNPTGQSVKATFGKVSPIDILPEIPQSLKYPEFGKGKNFRWAQNEREVQLRIKVPPDTRTKDINFNIGRTWIEVWIEGERVPRLQGKLFGRLKCLDEWLWELDGSGDDRHVAVFLEKTQEGMWEDIWEKPKFGEAVVDHEPMQADHETLPIGHGRKNLETIMGMTKGKKREPSAQQRFGIHTFTYLRRRPFSSERLSALLEAWPLPTQDKKSLALQDLAGGDNADAHSGDVLKPVLRSKGFCWVDDEPLKINEWAHAGRTLKVKPKDWWWSVLKEDQLDFQVSYPGAKREYERLRKSKWDARWGDRRQELIFIGGPDMDEKLITPLLDDCLLDDKELQAYIERTKDVAPDATYFGIEGLLRQMGADPAAMQAQGNDGEEAIDTETVDPEDAGGYAAEAMDVTPSIAKPENQSAGTDCAEPVPPKPPRRNRPVAVSPELEQSPSSVVAAAPELSTIDAAVAASEPPPPPKPARPGRRASAKPASN